MSTHADRLASIVERTDRLAVALRDAEGDTFDFTAAAAELEDISSAIVYIDDGYDESPPVLPGQPGEWNVDGNLVYRLRGDDFGHRVNDVTVTVSDCPPGPRDKDREARIARQVYRFLSAARSQA